MYILKGYGANEHIKKNFRINFWKSYEKNLYDGKTKRQRSIANCVNGRQHWRSLVLYSVIFVHKLNIIRKEYIVWLQIYSAATLPNIIKIGQHLTE